MSATSLTGETPPALRPVVELQNEVYRFTDPQNGAGPMWCHGSSAIVRVGEEVLVSGQETIEGQIPLNNIRWTLYRLTPGGWELVRQDDTGRTREPCPLACFPEGRVFLSVSPTLAPPDLKGGPATPQLLEFQAADPVEFKKLLPAWDGSPLFREHTYRSFAADGPNRELLLMCNVLYGHSEWAFFDREGQWSAAGQLKWPWGAEYDQPQPARLCYPTVALQDRRVYFCGVSDILEPYAKFREAKRRITGQEWDYDFRRLFYTWSDDIRSGEFHDWVEIASRDRTCGWIRLQDLYVAPDGRVHLLWHERALDERLRAEFYPDEKQSFALNYAIVQEGEVVLRRTLVEWQEDTGGMKPEDARFQITPEGRLFVFLYAEAADPGGPPLADPEPAASGQQVAGNWLAEIYPDGTLSPLVPVPLPQPVQMFYTATPRAGCAPSTTLDLLGEDNLTLYYARIELE